MMHTMRDTRILIVHPEPSARALMASMLQSLGPRLEDVGSDRAAVRRIDQGDISLVVAGVDPFDADSLEILPYIRRKNPRLPVILLFTVPHPERAREALQRGAASVLKFPLPATQLRAAVSQALGSPEPVSVAPAPSVQTANGSRESSGWTLVSDQPTDHSATANSNSNGNANGKGRTDTPLFVGEDVALRQALELARGIASSRSAVLIQGERGTGKSLLARALHHQGNRASGPFFEVQCGSMRESVLEVELFGRRSPGLGGTIPDVPGKLAAAHGGTLFLDDVASLSPELQFRLLRFLHEGQFEPVGSTQTSYADVRLVFGSRDDLSDRVARDEFRQDLYYRISVVSLKLPPLRHRGADIERLAEHFLRQAAQRYNRDVTAFSPEAITLLRHYEWPGNVEELEQAVQRAVLSARKPSIEPTDLGLVPARPAVAPSSSLSSRRAGHPGIRPLKEALEEPEKRIILQALEALNWNRQETARLLDINRTTLYKKMKKYGLLYDDEPAWAN